MNGFSPTLDQAVPRTAADLLSRIATDPDLTAGQRRSLTCDLRSFLRCIRADETTALDYGLFRERVANVLPSHEGISIKRWSNIRSGVGRALRRYGPTRRNHRRQPLTPEWRALYAALAGPRLQRVLSRFVGWASEASISTAAVDDEVMGGFHEFLAHETLVKDAQHLFRNTCKLWNDAAARIPDWSGRAVTLPCSRDLVSLPEASFPPSLWADFDRYASIMSGGDLLAPNAPDKPLRQTTLVHHRKQLRLFASAIVKAGIPPTQICRLSDLVDQSNFEAGVRWLHDRHKGNSASLFELVATLTAIARNYLQLPESQVQSLAAVKKRLNCRTRGMTDKNRQRLIPFKDRRRLGAFLNLSEALAVHARRLSSLQRKAVCAEVALAHELLLAAPMRFGNLVRLDLMRHFRFDGPGRTGRVTVSVPAEEVKNDRPLEFILPAAVGRRLAEFLKRTRPILLGDRQSNFLFPGNDHGHKHHVSLSLNLCKAVAQHVGIQVNPHLYRHIAAYIYLKVHPGEYETVRQLLGHSSIETTLRFYTDFERDSAVERYNAVVLEHRGQEPTSKRRKRS